MVVVAVVVAAAAVDVAVVAASSPTRFCHEPRSKTAHNDRQLRQIQHLLKNRLRWKMGGCRWGVVKHLKMLSKFWIFIIIDAILTFLLEGGGKR